jgi:tRNA(adenine34) deaminase
MNRVVAIAIKCQEHQMKNRDEHFMQIALKEAKKAYDQGEVPVGCIIVAGDEIIARAHNTRQNNHDPLGHAEVKAIQKAAKKRNAWILDDCELYVTLEPCLMCAGVILQSRIKRVVFGAFEPKFGVLGSTINIYEAATFNHQVEVKSGVLEEKCSSLMKNFFKELRNNKN